jgi:tetratricopeptide (TPR) repeat protein
MHFVASYLRNGVFSLVTLLALGAGCAREKLPEAAPEAYADVRSCASCHTSIAESYQKTVSMARSLYRPSAENIIEDYTRNNRFYHKVSDRYYEMIRRDGRFYQRRYQLDERGRPTHLLEVEVTHVIGSGKRTRSYLHRWGNGEITQLPITWYTQERRWGMSPGYDRARHPDFTRQVDHGCLFCHNAYPSVAPGADRYGAEMRFPATLPEGIDCQRCHGPGARHVDLASQGAAEEAVRGSIVNPRRLSPERQMDVCRQCHLEITSFPLPQAVRRFGRAAYSFRPGEALGDYLVHFDHPPGSGREDKFEIVSAAYRLEKSACFQKSAGRMTCTTCHDPHRAGLKPSCRECHPSLPAAHPAAPASDCVACHMPRRRTDDVVHVVITDHWIQRRKPARDLLAPLAEKVEAYHGDLVVYRSPPSEERDRNWYLGMALVIDGADRKRGIALLEAAAGEHAPIEVYIELGAAHLAEGNAPQAVRYYRKALDLDPALPRIRYNLARALEASGDTAGAAAEYERAVRESPGLGEAWNNLGALVARSGDPQRAAQHLETAVRVQPLNADAHNNLANVYAALGRPEAALGAADQALRVEPAFAPAHNSRGMILGRLDRLEDATAALERAVRLDPRLAEAHFNLGQVRRAQGRREEAIRLFRRALELQPTLEAARRGLADLATSR